MLPLPHVFLEKTRVCKHTQINHVVTIYQGVSLYSFHSCFLPSASRLSEKARICIFSQERKWKAALAEAIDTCQLPQEYGGTGPALADTPFLHEVHRALEKDAVAVAAAATADVAKALTVSAETVTAANPIGQLDEETAVGATSDDDVAAKTMAAILQHFSLDSHGYNFRNRCSVKGSLKDDDGRGSGGSVGDPVVETSKSQTGSDPQTPGSEDPSVSADFSGSEGLSGSEDLSGSEGLSGSQDLSGSEYLSGSEELSGSGYLSGSEKEPSVTSERSTHVTSVEHETQVDKSDGGADFGWVLDFFPGASLVTGVAGVVLGNTFGAALTAAGFAAGVMEAVVPDVVWAEGVRAFEESQFWGRRSLGFP